MTADPSIFPRIRIVSGRVLALAASLCLLAVSLLLMVGEREPRVRAGSTTSPVIYENKEP